MMAPPAPHHANHSDIPHRDSNKKQIYCFMFDIVSPVDIKAIAEHWLMLFFGPLTIRTKRGSITFWGAAVTVPLTGWSLYKVYEISSGKEKRNKRDTAKEGDLTGID